MRTNVGKKQRMIDFFKKYYLMISVVGNRWILEGGTYHIIWVRYFVR